MKLIHISSVLLAAMAGANPSWADACKPDCGQVMVVDRETREGQGSGAGAVIGGIAGGVLGHQIGSGRGNTLATIGGAAGGAYVGHQVEKKSKTRTVYVVRVRMDDGRDRSFDYSSEPAFAPGDRVKVSDRKLSRYTGP
jgi:uncharacterized protein YcfJ